MPETINPPLLARGAYGQNVIHLQSALAASDLFDGDIDGAFGPATQRALIAFQQRSQLAPTGLLTSTEAALLGWQRLGVATSKLPQVSADLVARLFSASTRPAIECNLPPVVNALVDAGLSDAPLLAMALATIRVETSSFLPISEQLSKFNTSPGGKPFDLYDYRKSLGNNAAPDGSRFRGRGFIQLTGRANYAHFSRQIGLADQLLANPFLAHDNVVAAKLLAAFLKSREARIRKALATQSYAEARRLVNGGSNGLAEFTNAIRLALDLLPDRLDVAA